MKRGITINNFGPIDYAKIDLEKNITVLIGAQASGKSTISKVIYFCLKIKDYLYDFMNDIDNFKDKHPNEYYTNFRKYLRAKFIGIFGKTTHMRHFNILYKFGNKEIQIKLDKDRYVYFVFCKDLKIQIEKIITEYADLTQRIEGVSLKDFISDLTGVALLRNTLTREISDIFSDERQIIYIPAGRSLLSTLSQKMRDFSLNDIDLTMRDFIELIESTRRKFGSKIPEIVKNYVKTVKGQINNVATDNAYKIVKQILRADYISDGEGEKVFFDDVHWVQLMFASSGQQEALWILMLLFSKILENEKSYIIIEEPEAHLFPMAQKYISELIALCCNATESNVFMTTHSPYILTSLNVLLYSNKIENSSLIKGVEPIIPKLCRLKYKNFAAFSIDNQNSEFKLVSLMDDETNMMRTDFIDKVSEITNSELEKLIDLEVRYDL